MYKTICLRSTYSNDRNFKGGIKMCTALTLRTKDGYNLFGRNMDLAYSFNQSVTLVPRNYEYRDRVTNKNKKTKYAIWLVL